MITKAFIEKVHDAFDELNYHETKQLNFNNFKQSFANTLIHCKDLIDAINAVSMYQFCLNNWDKIEKIFSRKLQLFNEYEYEGNSFISTVTDEDAAGTYYITNGISSAVKDVSVASISFGNNVYSISYKGEKFTVFENGKYYIKYAKLSSVKMKLFNNAGKCLCNIVLSEKLGIFLENNLTPYDLVVYEDFVGIYDRRYIESLSDTEIIDTGKLLGDIEWDILEKKSDLGVAKLNVYATEQDLGLSKANNYTNKNDIEMFLLFATSTFLVYQKFMKAQEKRESLSRWALWYSSQNVRR